MTKLDETTIIKMVSAESNNKEKCKNIVNTTLESVRQCYDKVR